MENYGYTKTENEQNQQNGIPYRSEKKIPAALDCTQKFRQN